MIRSLPKVFWSSVMRESADVAKMTEHYHLLWLTVGAAPLCLLAAFLAFPYLGRWNYPAFHFACLLSLFIAGLGLWGWLAQCLHRGRVSGLVSALLLLSFAAGAIVCRIFGDFY